MLTSVVLQKDDGGVDRGGGGVGGGWGVRKPGVSEEEVSSGSSGLRPLAC